MTYIIYPAQTKSSDQLGGKAGALAALHQTELHIPAWFVVSPQAFYDSLGVAPGDSLTAAKILPLLCRLNPNAAVQHELEQALAGLCPNGEAVAVRSSALDEDGLRHSFAGQLDSFLGVAPADAVDKIASVWRSAFSDRILAYRREHGLNTAPQAPAVLIQRMIKADLSGVAFSANPVSGQRDVAVISAVCGLGDALVSGEVDADTYCVDRQGQIIERNIVAARLPVAAVQNKANGTAPLPASPTLTDDQIRSVAALARRTEQFFGQPQDVEWAIQKEQLFLLQSRPITTLTNQDQPLNGGDINLLQPSAPSKPTQVEGVLNLWDNSNIAESYPGVTTPLTFSFARRAYEEVYRQFCRMMGVPAEKIANNDTTFRRMLGLMQGRIYYNLLSWYRVLALLPGYKINRRFMEQMMGVKESLPAELVEMQTTPTRGERLRDGLHLLGSIMGLLVNYLLLPRRIAKFYRRLNRALGDGRPDLSRNSPDELVAYYRNLEQQLLTRWDAPLVNDFFAMIFYGLLRSLTGSWGNDANGTLQNDLMANTGGIISAEPVKHMLKMAHLAASDPDFVTTLCAGSLAEILAHLPKFPEFERAYQAYLDRFGDRCLEELKLESPTLHDDPGLLLRSIGQLAQRQAKEQGSSTSSAGLAASPHANGDENRQRAPQLSMSKKQLSKAEQQVRTALAGHPLRQFIFRWVLNNARILIRNRENLRFERTRLFGRARMIFVELGRTFHALKLLADPRDIFYLEAEEIFATVNGTATTTDLKSLVALRRAEFERYYATEALPGRFETRGIPYQSIGLVSDNSSMEDQIRKPKIQDPKSLKGLGCSPGLVRGPVRVVSDPKACTLQPGEILVAERTDPGWILLFPAAAGLLVEYGSLLSHSAIVSREMNLPAVVSIPNVTQWLTTGDWVEFDGSTGVVSRIKQPND